MHILGDRSLIVPEVPNALQRSSATTMLGRWSPYDRLGWKHCWARVLSKPGMLT